MLRYRGLPDFDSHEAGTDCSDKSHLDLGLQVRAGRVGIIRAPAPSILLNLVRGSSPSREPKPSPNKFAGSEIHAIYIADFRCESNNRFKLEPLPSFNPYNVRHLVIWLNLRGLCDGPERLQTKWIGCNQASA